MCVVWWLQHAGRKREGGSVESLGGSDLRAPQLPGSARLCGQRMSCSAECVVLCSFMERLPVTICCIMLKPICCERNEINVNRTGVASELPVTIFQRSSAAGSASSCCCQELLSGPFMSQGLHVAYGHADGVPFFSFHFIHQPCGMRLPHHHVID